MSDISAEITDSLSRSGKGAMLAPLELADGTAGAPALTFDTDTDTGVYLKGANNLAVAVGGAEVLDVQAAGVDVAGRVAATGAVSGTTGTFSDAISGTSGTFSGNLALTGSNPAATDSFTDTLTPLNIPKAWGSATTDGSGGATLNAGFNVTSVGFNGSAILVTLAGDIGSGSYAVLLTSYTSGHIVRVASKVAGSFLVGATTHAGAAVDFTTAASTVDFVVFGAQ